MKIAFISSNRCHQRQKLLLDELRKHFEVVIGNAEIEEGNMGQIASAMTSATYSFLKHHKPDLVLVRGDRSEQLSVAMMAAYMNTPIAHLEGFDLSGVIDNKVRYAISYLSDFHFVTNSESYKRAKSMNFEKVWDFGSLDVEYAISVADRSPKIAPGSEEAPKVDKYLMVLYHPILNEDKGQVYKALESFSDYKIIGVKSNKDYGDQTYIEEYSPEEFIRLLKGASCLVGNSSAGIKEAPALGVNVCNIGERQANRLKPENVRNCKCEKEDIEYAINYQLNHKLEPSTLYYKPDTSKKIAEVIRRLTP